MGEGLPEEVTSNLGPHTLLHAYRCSKQEENPAEPSRSKTKPDKCKDLAQTHRAERQECFKELRFIMMMAGLGLKSLPREESKIDFGIDFVRANLSACLFVFKFLIVWSDWGDEGQGLCYKWPFAGSAHAFQKLPFFTKSFISTSIKT